MRTLLAVVAAGLLVAADDRGDAEKADLKKLQGTWQFVKHEVDGNPIPEDMLKEMTITFEGDKFSVKSGDKVVQAGTHKLDPTKKPATVDATVSEGDGKGTTMLGIYELSDDTVKFCFDPQGKKRPTEFKGAPGVTNGTIKKKKN